VELTGRMVIVTGPRGAGKTSLCRRLVSLARERGWRVAGVLSHARFEGGQKVGIEAENLVTGERRLLAVPRTDAYAGEQQLGWIFDGEALEWGDEILAHAGGADLLVVDELGPLEFDQGRGWLSGLAALDRGEYRLALAVIRPELLARAQERWKGAQVIEIGAVEEVGEIADQLLILWFD
jgi:nucleoside-triphosphatase